MDKKWKKRFNILIPYYRKRYLRETSDTRWTQKRFYYDAENKCSICSNNSYTKLENDICYLRDEIYLFAAKQLQKKVDTSFEIEDLFDHYIAKLANRISFGHTEDIAEIVLEVNQQFGYFEHYIYYEDIFYGFALIARYYDGEYDCISDDDYQRLIMLLEIYPEQLKHIIMELMYCYANIRGFKIMDTLIKEYNYETSPFLPNQITYLIYSIMNNHNVMQTMDKAKDMILQLEEMNNYIPLSDLYILLSNITCKIDKEYSRKCFERAIVNIETHEVPQRVKLSTYLNAGYYYITESAYGVALNYLLKVLAIKEIMIPKNYACVIFCYHMLKMRVPEKYLAYKGSKYDDQNDIDIYYFLAHIGTLSGEQNARYIKKTIYKSLRPEETLYIFMLKLEIHRICAPKGKYNLYYDFCEKFSAN